MTEARSRPIGWFAIALAYVVLLVAVGAGLGSMRRWAARTLATPQARSEWQQYREAVAGQVERGDPVRRRVPTSVEPPALVLLRDHFAVCLTLAIVLSSALFATVAFFVRGAITRPGSEPVS